MKATLLETLVGAGRKFIRLYKRSKAVAADKKQVGDALQVDLLNAGLTKIDCGRSGAVVFASGTRKDVTKAAIVAAFGDAGASFWDGIEAETYQYLTVVS